MMEKLKNKTLQNFLDNLIEELKNENKNIEYDNIGKNNKIAIFDIPFLTSVLWESFRTEPNTYSDFVECLKKAYNYQIRIVNSDDNYDGICKAIVDFYISDNIQDGFEEYQYEIHFSYDPRDWGYCECTPNDEDYREDKHCCGHGCDWWAPSFEIKKSYYVGRHSWSGDEHDYWDFEDKFYLNDEEECKKKRQKEIEREIYELKNKIENDKAKLSELESLIKE